MFEPADLVLVVGERRAGFGVPPVVARGTSAGSSRSALEVFHFDHRLRSDSGKDADVRPASRRAGSRSVPPRGRDRSDRSQGGSSKRGPRCADGSRETGLVADEIGASDRGRRAHARRSGGDGAARAVRGTGSRRPRRDRSRNRDDALVQPLFDVERVGGRGVLPCPAPAPPSRSDERGHGGCSATRSGSRRSRCSSERRARGVASSLARTAANLRGGPGELFEATVRRADGTVSVRRTTDDCGISTRQRCGSLSDPMAARVVRLGVYDALAADEQPWSKPAIDAVLDLARGRPGRARPPRGTDRAPRPDPRRRHAAGRPSD